MLMYFIFAKLAIKLRRFSDDQMKTWHTSKLRRFRLKLKTKTSGLDDTVSSYILKSKNKEHEELTPP